MPADFAREKVSTFSAPPAALSLSEDEIHLWRLDRREWSGELLRMRDLLSAPERERAGRFHFAKDRDFYIARHGALRVILGRYLPRNPAELAFSYSARGKPSLETGELHFNDSHSSDCALFAVTKACSLGVDIEAVRPIPEFENIAERYFSPREVAMMRALPPEIRMHAFYTAWTRKEAFLKATGEGITVSLPKVEVTLSPEDPPAILAVPGDPDAATAWKMKAFSPAQGYLGAIAFRHCDLELKLWSASPATLR